MLKTALFLKCFLSGSLWREPLEVRDLISPMYSPIAQRRDEKN